MRVLRLEPRLRELWRPDLHEPGLALLLRLRPGRLDVRRTGRESAAGLDELTPLEQSGWIKPGPQESPQIFLDAETTPEATRCQSSLVARKMLIAMGSLSVGSKY